MLPQTYKLKALSSISRSSMFFNSILGFPEPKWIVSDYKLKVMSSMREGERVGMRKSLEGLGTFLQIKSLALGRLLVSFNKNCMMSTL